jgi:hypothetical protein
MPQNALELKKDRAQSSAPEREAQSSSYLNTGKLAVIQD